MRTKHILPRLLLTSAGRIGTTGLHTHFAVIFPAMSTAHTPQEFKIRSPSIHPSASFIHASPSPGGKHTSGSKASADTPGWLILERHRGELRAAISSGLFTPRA